MQYLVSFQVLAIMSLGKSGLVALLSLSSWCLVTVVVLKLFLAVPWDGLQCVVVEFSNHTHFSF